MLTPRYDHEARSSGGLRKCWPSGVLLMCTDNAQYTGLSHFRLLRKCDRRGQDLILVIPVSSRCVYHVVMCLYVHVTHIFNIRSVPIISSFVFPPQPGNMSTFAYYWHIVSLRRPLTRSSSATCVTARWTLLTLRTFLKCTCNIVSRLFAFVHFV